MASDDYLILFGDLIGSTEVASEASTSVFSRLYIASFYLAIKCATQYIKEPVFPTVIFKKIIEGIQLSGDEVFSLTKISKFSTDELNDVVASAVAFSFALKVFWMASPYNIKRLYEKKFPRDIALGIHIGPAERILDDPKSNIVGLHINVTKRLETAARSGGNSRIFVSDYVAYIYRRWLDKWKDLPSKKIPPLLYSKFNVTKTPIDLKGLPVKVSAFELQINKKDQMKLQYLFEMIYQSSDHIDSETENAVRKLADILLDNLFEIESLYQYVDNISSPENYINLWFQSVSPLPHMFLNDIWTIMVTFFLSCGFVRRRGMNRKIRKKYDAKTEKIMIRLREMLSSINEEG